MYKLRHPAHYLAGIIAAVAGIFNPYYTLGGIALFLVYEIWQDVTKHDKSYWDILEFVIAYFVSIAGITIWRFLT